MRFTFASSYFVPLCTVALLAVGCSQERDAAGDGGIDAASRSLPKTHSGIMADNGHDSDTPRRVPREGGMGGLVEPGSAVLDGSVQEVNVPKVVEMKATDCNDSEVLSCLDNDVVLLNPCRATPLELESCERDCFQGRCVDCVPNSGVVCDGDNRRRVDSCQVLGEVIEECELGCASGECQRLDCVPSDATECHGELLYTYDSCGILQNAEHCRNGCSNGACLGCQATGAMTCFRGDIYALNSCEQPGELVQICADSCFEGEGEAAPVACLSPVASTQCRPSEEVRCLHGDIYPVDSCGSPEAEVLEDCPSGCDPETKRCLSCVETVQGAQCSEGAIVEILGGCGGELSLGEQIADCSFGCQAGRCLAESECLGGAGRTCVGDVLHEVDSCQVVQEPIQSCQFGCTSGDCRESPLGIPDTGPSGSGGADGGRQNERDSGRGGTGGIDSGPGVASRPDGSIAPGGGAHSGAAGVGTAPDKGDGPAP